MSVVEIVTQNNVVEVSVNQSVIEIVSQSNVVEINDNKGIQGTQGETGDLNLANSWIGLATGWKTTPVLNTTIADGDVYNYVFAGDPGDVTYYRLVPSGAADDAFYSTFSGGVLSGLIAKKEIVV